MEQKPLEGKRFRLGEWLVDPRDCTVRSADSTRRVEPQVIELLLCLASHPGQVVSRQQIVEEVWQGRLVSEDSLTGSISQLRKALGDETRSPRYIETIPKRGYRLLLSREEGDAAPPRPPGLAGGRGWRPAAGGLILVLGAAGWWLMPAVRHEPAVASLAVLPLKNLSPEPNDAYLADGVTSALITELAKLAPLRVISHTSVMRYRASRGSAAEIAGELKVDAILEGSVARSGRRVRVDAQLTDARRDAHLWAEAYERDVEDLLQLQSEIAQSIAGSIRLRLQDGRRAGGAGRVSAEAVEAYLKGRVALDQRTPDALKQSRVYFQRAVDLDPRFAGAFAGLADSSTFMIGHGLAAPSDLSAQARSAARRALELDPDLAEAHASQGAVLGFLDWQLPPAEEEFRRALQLQPGLARAHLGYALLLSAMGRHKEAIKEGRQALALDPLNLPAHWSLAEILIVARRYDEVVAQMGRALELDPDYSNAHFGIGLARWLQAREPDAWDAYRAGLRSEGIASEAIERLDATFSREGMGGVFNAVAQYLERQPVQTPDAQRSVVLYYCLAGNRDRAFPLLEQAYQQHSPLLLWLPASPYADRLRDDPRFTRLVRRLPSPTTPTRLPGA